VGFLRRLLGGSDPARAADTEVDLQPDLAELDAAERQHELDLLREEQARLDELQQRQERYAKYAWQPPAQGGERRADDSDEAAGG
jgi:hypothetical protein